MGDLFGTLSSTLFSANYCCDCATDVKLRLNHKSAATSYSLTLHRRNPHDAPVDLATTSTWMRGHCQEEHFLLLLGQNQSESSVKHPVS